MVFTTEDTYQAITKFLTGLMIPTVDKTHAAQSGTSIVYWAITSGKLRSSSRMTGVSTNECCGAKIRNRMIWAHYESSSKLPTMAANIHPLTQQVHSLEVTYYFLKFPFSSWGCTADIAILAFSGHGVYVLGTTH